MVIGLLLLVFGFACNLLSAFTTSFCRRFGEERGRLATFVLRNILGIPVWSLGLVFAVRAPSARLFAASLPIRIAGWFALGAGCVVIILALHALRGRAALPSTHDGLVRSGPYRLVRHPIHSGLLLTLLALVLVRPTRAVLLACAITAAWVLVQSRFEELDLLQRLPPYRTYMKDVPAFVPRARRRVA